jgi:hypothetical protein
VSADTNKNEFVRWVKKTGQGPEFSTAWQPFYNFLKVSDKVEDLQRKWSRWAMMFISTLSSYATSRETLIVALDAKVADLEEHVVELKQTIPEDAFYKRLSDLSAAAANASDLADRAKERHALEMRTFDMLGLVKKELELQARDMPRLEKEIGASSKDDVSKLLEKIEVWELVAALDQGREELRKAQEKLKADQAAFEDRCSLWASSQGKVLKGVTLAASWQAIHMTHMVTAPSDGDAVDASYNVCKAWKAPNGRVVRNPAHPYWQARECAQWLKSTGALNDPGSEWFQAGSDPRHKLFIGHPHKRLPNWGWFKGLEHELNDSVPVKEMMRVLADMPLPGLPHTDFHRQLAKDQKNV